MLDSTGAGFAAIVVYIPQTGEEGDDQKMNTSFTLFLCTYFAGTYQYLASAYRQVQPERLLLSLQLIANADPGVIDRHTERMTRTRLKWTSKRTSPCS